MLKIMLTLFYSEQKTVHVTSIQVDSSTGWQVDRFGVLRDKTVILAYCAT